MKEVFQKVIQTKYMKLCISTWLRMQEKKIIC